MFAQQRTPLQRIKLHNGLKGPTKRSILGRSNSDRDAGSLPKMVVNPSSLHIKEAITRQYLQSR